MKKLITLFLTVIVIVTVGCNNGIKNKYNPKNKPIEIDELEKEKNESKKNEFEQEKKEKLKKELEEERLKNFLENNLNKEKKKDNPVDLSKPENLDKTESIPNK